MLFLLKLSPDCVVFYTTVFRVYLSIHSFTQAMRKTTERNGLKIYFAQTRRTISFKENE